MSRKRFEDIKKFIPFANNDNLTAGNKLAKIRCLQDKVNASLQQFGLLEKDLSIDEQVVPYFGRHSAKMFIRGKPIRLGYKNWVLASSDGYPYKFGTYLEHVKQRTAASLLVLKLCLSDLLSIAEKPACHRFYFDNFFTSYLLLRDLHEKGVKALGTILENRTIKCPLKSSKSVEKEKRGFFDSRSDECASIVAIVEGQ